jgi:hypothetical protein
MPPQLTPAPVVLSTTSSSSSRSAGVTLVGRVASHLSKQPRLSKFRDVGAALRTLLSTALVHRVVGPLSKGGLAIVRQTDSAREGFEPPEAEDSRLKPSFHIRECIRELDRKG